MSFFPFTLHRATTLLRLHWLLRKKQTCSSFSPIPGRLLYVAASCLPYHISGYTSRTHELLCTLRADGGDVRVVTRTGYPWDRRDSLCLPEAEATVIDDVTYTHSHTPRNNRFTAVYAAQASVVLEAYARSQRVAVIHAASNHVNALPALIAARRLGLPFQYEMRGLWELTRASRQPSFENSHNYHLGLELEGFVATHADRVFVISRQLGHYARQRWNIPESRLSLLPNCVDGERIKPAPHDVAIPLCIGYAGSLINYEGLDTLVDAMALLRQRGITASLHIMGEGEARAALYPMVTINGEECHNEWEITFEEIHRNGAIAYAIHNYIRYTGDEAYLADCGLEVLVGIARFWAQRITWSAARQKYVLLGVTGPNEYENNVNNNWYTSYIACWSMRYAARAAAWVRENRPADYARICAKRAFDEAAETAAWLRIADNMYLGEDPERGIFLQQDGYLDKEQTLVRDLDPEQRPINQKWSWDRILRSCFIKQADVLQGLYFFGEEFDLETLRRNFYFYEPRTVHESSLSPCVHAVLAARLGDMAKAGEMYLRTARLDLDDYNREVGEGCHVTSMAGSWLSVVEGFGGMCVRDGVLTFDPRLPEAWESLSFKVNFRGRVLTVKVTRTAVEVSNEGAPVPIAVCGEHYTVETRVIHQTVNNR